MSLSRFSIEVVVIILGFFLHQKRKLVEINVFAVPTSLRGLCYIPSWSLRIAWAPITLCGNKKFYLSAFCLYCTVRSVKSMVFNSVYTLLFQTHISECRVISTKSYWNVDDNMDTMMYMGYLRDYFIAVECFEGSYRRKPHVFTIRGIRPLFILYASWLISSRINIQYQRLKR